MVFRKYFVRGKFKPCIEHHCEFLWYPGTSNEALQKCSMSFHKSIKSSFKHSHSNILEVSSFSNNELGKACSTSKLTIDGYPLESVFIASQVFSNHKSYPETLTIKPSKAKQYIKQQIKYASLTKYTYQGKDFPIQPENLFYDYLYCLAINQSSNIDKSKLLHYQIFTDTKYKCADSQGNIITNITQARSLCIYTYLYKHNLLNQCLTNIETFKQIVYQIN